MEFAQIYETLTANRERPGQGVRVVTAPAQYMESGHPPPISVLADQFFERTDLPLTHPEPWMLPFLIDGLLGQLPDGFSSLRLQTEPGFESESTLAPPPPSHFAQHVAFDPIIPYEASRLSGRSLAELVGAGGGASGAIGYAQTGDPQLLLVLAAGIILCGAAAGVAEALRIGLRAKLLDLMNVEDPEQREQ